MSKHVSYRELREKLNTEELGQTATVYLKNMDEYFAVEAVKTADDDGVLDEGHLILVIPA